MKTKLKDMRMDFESGFVEIKDGTMEISDRGEKREFLSELFIMMIWREDVDDEAPELEELAQILEDEDSDWLAILQHCRDELENSQSMANIIHRMNFTEDYALDEFKRQHRQSCMKNPCLYFKTRHHVSVSKRVAKDIVTEAHDNVVHDAHDFIAKYEKGLKKELARDVFGSVNQLLDLDSRSLDVKFSVKWREYVSNMCDEAISQIVKQKCNPKPPNGGQAAEEHGIREAKA